MSTNETEAAKAAASLTDTVQNLSGIVCWEAFERTTQFIIQQAITAAVAAADERISKLERQLAEARKAALVEAAEAFESDTAIAMAQDNGP